MEKKQTQGRYPRCVAQHLRAWLPELGALMASTLLLITLLGFLIAAPTFSDWRLPWQLRPNSVVALLATLCRFFLNVVLSEGISQLKWVYFQQRSQQLSDFQTFDNASYDPWGALQLLWRLKGRALIASLGALITIAVLVMDPLSQQLLSYGIRVTDVTDAIATTSVASIDDTGATLSRYEAALNDGLGML